MDDIQAQLRALADEYLDSHLIEKITVQADLLDITEQGYEHKRYLPTGRLTVTIVLASR